MSDDLTATFSVEQSPEQVSAAINDVSAWWGAVDGPTDELGAEFSYVVGDLHYSKMRVTELVPGRRVVWLVTDSRLSFVADQQEWTGTRITFDLSEADGLTTLVFTHVGLTPATECFDACNHAWGGYITGSLRDLVTTGVGRPNTIEGQEVLDAVSA